VEASVVDVADVTAAGQVIVMSADARDQKEIGRAHV
jgi:hypothetical protein